MQQRSIFVVRLALLALAAMLATPGSIVAAAGQETREPEIAGPLPGERGAWRTRIQTVFDPATRKLSRRLYTVWDADPARDLDFTWLPDDSGAGRPGRINGTGLLIWRIRGKPAYDRSSIFAEYRGALRHGQIEGRGIYLDNTGLLYEGEWKAGLMHGLGTLKQPNGDEYVGRFRAGRADGPGRHIDVTGEIYRGPFVAGRRHGRGTTILPNGRAYSSFWVDGREQEESRRIRLAQAPGAPALRGNDDIRIGILLDKRLPYSGRTEEPFLKSGDLWYSVANAATGLLIRPDNKRLMSMWKEGGEIQLRHDEENKNFEMFGVLSLVRGQLVPLSLIVEVQNRSARDVQVSGVTVNVDSSAGDLQPAIQMAEESAFAPPHFEGDYLPTRFVENFGWSAAQDARLKFAFVSHQGPARNPPLTRTLDIGTLERSAKIDFEPHLRAVGVDVGKLRRDRSAGFRCRSNARAECLREVKATGVFGSLADLVSLDPVGAVVDVLGELEYAWNDNKGARRTASSPFRIKLSLGNLKSELESGEGGSREIITRTAQRLRLDAANYRIPISYQANVAAGRTSRLVLPIEAEKSSSHDFRIVLQLADGREVSSRPINLLYYRPRWFASYNRKGADAEDSAFANVDLVGHDLRQLRDTNKWECDNACKDDARCQAYAFDKWDRLCALKSTVSLRRFDARYDSGTPKGSRNFPAAEGPRVLEPYPDRAFPGQAYMIQQQSELGRCRQHCAGENRCIAFTFRKKAADCYLFDELEKGHAANPDAESAVKRQPAR
jgi:hypothetical protein